MRARLAVSIIATLVLGGLMFVPPANAGVPLPDPPDWSTIGNSGTTAGTNFVGTTDDEPLQFHVNGQRILLLEPGNNLIGGNSTNSVAAGQLNAFIGGGAGNQVTLTEGTIGGGSNNLAGNQGTVGGGSANKASATQSTVGGGSANEASDIATTVAGGGLNRATGFIATVGGGLSNLASGDFSTIAGGGFFEVTAGLFGNEAEGKGAAIGGGVRNQAGGDYSTIAGGGGPGDDDVNRANGLASTVPGGRGNWAEGITSFAAGVSAKALHDGSFVWADRTGVEFSSTADNQFSSRAIGGHRFVVTLPAESTPFRGAVIEPSGEFGIGTQTPAAQLHVIKEVPGGIAAQIEQGALLVNRTDGNASNIRFATPARNYLFQNNPTNQIFSIRDETANNSPLSINPNAGSNLLVLKSGQWGLGVGSPAAGRAIDTNTGAFLSTAGVWTNASSRSLKTNIDSLSVEEALSVLKGLDPVTFEYKKALGDGHVGFIAEDVPELVATAGRKGLSSMDIVAVAVKVLQEANSRLDAKDSQLAGQKAQIDDLESRLASLEVLLAR